MVFSAEFNLSVKNIVEKNALMVSNESKYWFPLAIPTFGADEILEALDSMVTFKTTMWDKTRRFEEEFGRRYGAEAIMVNSGSSADLLLMFALNEKSGGPLEDGATILVPAVTWPTQIWSIKMAGFEPKLVDVDPKTFNVDFMDLRSKIDSNTKAIFLVHLMGNPVNMKEIVSICEEFNLLLLEDCCESIDAKFDGKYVGTFGLGSSFSFFFSHHITTMEGGMILTSDTEFAKRCRLLRAHGWSRHLGETAQNFDGIDPRYTFINWGFNVRPMEVSASFGLHQLKRLSEFNDNRAISAAHLASIFSKYPDFFVTMKVAPESTCSWFAFPVRILNNQFFTRDSFCDFLEKNGVETRPIVAGNIARQPGYINLMGEPDDSLYGADEVHKNGFYVGVHPKDYSEQLNKLDIKIGEFMTLTK